ncbi:MAG: hypothetical protein VX899_23750 [Myxococcota bacterium]|nr:hypothetical protein [Myxococcota bacterium]
MLFVLLTACRCAAPGDSADTGSDPWLLVGDRLGETVLLGAWSTDSEMLIVGGDLGSDSARGDLIRIGPDSACAQRGVADQPLWWIHGQSAQDWWAVGNQGTALHWDGAALTAHPVPTTANLFGVYTYPDGTVWTVGGTPANNQGEIWRWDGGQWVQVQSGIDGLTFKVWEDWIVGVEQAWRIQGESVQPIDTQGRLITVRGRSADEVIAVGGEAGPLILERDGESWSEIDGARLNGPLNGVWTAPGETVWVAGNYGVMGQLGADGWEIPDFPLTAEHFHAVWQWDGAMWWLGGNYFTQGNNYGTLACHGCDRSIESLPDCE